MVAELIAGVTLVLMLIAESAHTRRLTRGKHLLFGPSGRPATWTRFVPLMRVGAASLMAWSLVSLILVPPQTHSAALPPKADRKHLILVLDVSPSMRLADAGPSGEQVRMKRAADVLNSFFERTPVEQYLITVIACYSDALPVVEQTEDLDVIANVLSDLPMHHAFSAGKTDLLKGIELAFETAAPLNPRSATLLVLTDGDSVPATGMSRKPASINQSLIVGVGDPSKGTFIDGGMSRQDAPTLRQIATRLDGLYHDANAKQIPTDVLSSLGLAPRQSERDRWGRREYALIGLVISAIPLAALPVLLAYWGNPWRVGVTVPRLARKRPTPVVPRTL